MTTISPIYVTSEKGVKAREMNAIVAGIRKVLKVANKEAEITNLGNWSEQKVRTKGELKPQKSTDWYIEQGRKKSEREGQLKANTILDKLAFEPWREDDYYDVLITNTDLYSRSDTNFIVGVAQRNVGTVLSPYRFRSLNSETKWQCLITEAMHELGHVFNVPARKEPDTTDSLGTHCTNTCVMRQGSHVPGDWVSMSEDRQKHGAFCNKCQQDLKSFSET